MIEYLLGSSRQAPLYSRLLVAAAAVLPFVGLPSVARAQDGPLDRRQPAPTVFDSPIRLEYPSGSILLGASGIYEPQIHGGGLGGTFFSPHAAAQARWTDGTTRFRVHRNRELYGSLGIGGASPDIEVSPFYMESDDKQRELSGSTSIDSAGLTQQTSQSQIDLDKVRRYGVLVSGSFPLRIRPRAQPYGRFLAVAYFARMEQDQRVQVAGSAHTTGTLVIPGVPQPVVIDNTTAFESRARVRRTVTTGDLRLAYDLSWLFVDNAPSRDDPNLIVGLWGAYQESDVRASLLGGSPSSLVDDKEIRRSLGLDALFAIGEPEDGRLFLSGTAGLDQVGSSARFTGQGLLMVTGRPFDDMHQISLAAMASGRGGVQRMGLSFVVMDLQRGRNRDEPDESEAYDFARSLESVLQRELSLSRDERFDERTRQRMLRDIQCLEMQGLEALRFDIGFDTSETDSVYGLVHVPLQFFDPDFPNFGLTAGGHWGHPSRREGSGINERDYSWFARLVWNPRGAPVRFYGGLGRTGDAQGLSTSAELGFMFNWGSRRRGYHELFESSSSPGSSGVPRSRSNHDD